MPKPTMFKITGTVYICEPCMMGLAGECHSPGCLFWMCSAPDIPLKGKLEDQFGCLVEAEQPITEADLPY